MNALDFLVTKLVSSFEPDKSVSHTRGLVIYLSQRVGPMSLFMLLVLISNFKTRTTFFKSTDIGSVIAIWLLIYLSLIITVLRSVLKGWLRFTDLVSNQIIEIVIRLILSVALIYFISVWYGWGLLKSDFGLGCYFVYDVVSNT